MHKWLCFFADLVSELKRGFTELLLEHLREVNVVLKAHLCSDSGHGFLSVLYQLHRGSQPNLQTVLTGPASRSFFEPMAQGRVADVVLLGKRLDVYVGGKMFS